MSNLGLLLSSLKQVEKKGPGRWLACCPAHDDRSPSMAIKETDDGRILIHCFAGCGASDILDAVDMKLGDLFPDKLDQAANIYRGHKHAFNARDAVSFMAKESLFLAACCVTLSENGELPAGDRDRLMMISGRLLTIADEVL